MAIPVIGSAWNYAGRKLLAEFATIVTSETLHEIAYSTIAEIFQRHGIEPAPGAKPDDDLEGVSDPALGADCCR